MNTALVVPSFLRSRALTLEGNNLVVNGRVVDTDAAFIGQMIDLKTNDWIGRFSETYVVDVTAHCNMSCKYCYYKVDNTTEDRSIESILLEVKLSGLKNICLMGAEPTTREDLFRLIRALVGQGYIVGITTNGKKLLDKEYCVALKAAGLTYLNYSMHFSAAYKISTRKAQVVKNLIDVGLPVCQWAFTISTLEELAQVVTAIDFLIDLGAKTEQFVIRAGAAIGDCKLDSGLFMSDMAKLALSLGATKMEDGGSNLYFNELIYRGFNLHLVRWPDNATVTPMSQTGPVFGTPLGPMRSPLMQVVSALTPVQIQFERRLLIDNKRTIHEVSRDFGTLKAIERGAWPGRIWLHCDMAAWGLREAKECLRVWPEFLKELVALGYKEAYSCIPKGDLKLRKWQEKFGLTEVSQLGDALVFRRSLDYGN